ncbi:magnesium transporter [Parvibaculum sp.]|uniref:magnesium transporter n=1 Tax=Parvibaculum sp. TaxID=2024848 RepID=UPI003918AA1E
MTNNHLADTLFSLIERGETRAAAELFGKDHPADIAATLAAAARKNPRAAWAALELLPLPRQAESFGYLDHIAQTRIAAAAPRAKLARLVTEMNADERADLFNEMSGELAEALLPALAQAEREDIRRLAAYEDGTAGAIMTSDYATLPQHLTAAEAIEKLRREAPDKETIYRAYVTDAGRRLIGAVRLQDLILAPARALVGDIMDRNTHAISVHDDQEHAARQIARYDVIALPVVDDQGRIVGIVTHDDAMDVMQEEATEDFHRTGTVSPLAANVRDAGIFLLYRARIVWLVVLVFGNIFSGAGIAAFEDTIAAYVALVFFLPLLIDSGGNAGSQSATLMVRALATGDVRIGDWGQMLGRELLVAALLGLSMAAAVSLIGVVRGGPEIALVVASAMVIIVIVGSLIGMTLPFVLTRFNLDPATASAPLVTSIADAAGVLIYFAIATAFLPLPG